MNFPKLIITCNKVQAKKQSTFQEELFVTTSSNFLHADWFVSGGHFSLILVRREQAKLLRRFPKNTRGPKKFSEAGPKLVRSEDCQR